MSKAVKGWNKALSLKFIVAVRRPEGQSAAVAAAAAASSAPNLTHREADLGLGSIRQLSTSITLRGRSRAETPPGGTSLGQW